MQKKKKKKNKKKKKKKRKKKRKKKLQTPPLAIPRCFLHVSFFSNFLFFAVSIQKVFSATLHSLALKHTPLHHIKHLSKLEKKNLKKKKKKKNELNP